MIKKETILSNYDNKLTLLQWLKALDKNITELQEKGVDMHLLVFNSVQEFYEYFKKLGNGVSSFNPFLINTAELYIYAFGETILYDNDTPESPEGNSINVYGMIGTIDESDNGRFAMGAQIYLSELDGKAAIDDISPITNWYPTYAETNSLIDEIKQSTNFKLLTTDLNGPVTLHQLTPNKDSIVNGFVYGNSQHTITCIGKIKGFSGFTKKIQGIITKDDEIFYTAGTGTIKTSTGEIQNAVSGTQLKEAVSLATQKTYWHTIRLHNSGTLSDVNITIVIPSHSNNPVANVQDLLAIGAGDIWGCSGTIATTESALPIVTFDAVKFGATAEATIFSGTLGRTYTLTQLIAKSLEYEDNVKEVK